MPKRVTEQYFYSDTFVDVVDGRYTVVTKEMTKQQLRHLRMVINEILDEDVVVVEAINSGAGGSVTTRPQLPSPKPKIMEMG
jgi:hypothetical protein